MATVRKRKQPARPQVASDDEDPPLTLAQQRALARHVRDIEVGEASGEARGKALRWKYVMALPVDGKVYNVDFDDWMFLMDDRVMLNRSVMSKFGFHLGEVTLSFRKRE